MSTRRIAVQRELSDCQTNAPGFSRSLTMPINRSRPESNVLTPGRHRCQYDSHGIGLAQR
eukprot:587289-Pyramimonas_sp.AAC.1